MTSQSPDDRWAPCLLELREEITQLEQAMQAIEELVSELSDADRARFLQLTRLANATANQLPNRTQFFADLAPSDARISAPMP